ncbi:MAG: hypothetical protein L3J19_06395 [Sulfurimonas sp.]|nr:hypothetical protein [Sulfurimonas sp.]
MRYLKQHENTENFMEALLRNHKVYRPIVEILDNIVKDAKELNWLDFEEIALAISSANNSEFCKEIHRGTKDAINNNQSSVAVSEDLDIIISFSLKLNKNPNDITVEDIKRVQDKRWSDETIENVISWVGAVNMYNTMANGFGFSDELPSEAFDQMATETTNRGGYVSVFDYFASQS